MKVAFTTQDMKRVDSHFGSAKKIAVYEVSPDQSQFVEALEFDLVSDEDSSHDAENDRLGAKVEALRGCALLFTLAIGGPAAARVVNNRVHPIKIQQPEAISDVIGRVQTMLNGNPPPWMRKILQGETKSMAFMEDDE